MLGMRRFRCDRCRAEVSFTDLRCPQCAVELGYEPRLLQLSALEIADADARTYRTAAGSGACWRCMNAAWGCNWLVGVGDGTVWCRSCALTRGRPDTADLSAVQAWMTAEAAKRRIVHQLDAIGLPLVADDGGVARALTFDLVHVPGEHHFHGSVGVQDRPDAPMDAGLDIVREGSSVVAIDLCGRLFEAARGRSVDDRLEELE